MLPAERSLSLLLWPYDLLWLYQIRSEKIMCDGRRSAAALSKPERGRREHGSRFSRTSRDSSVAAAARAAVGAAVRDAARAEDSA